MYFDVIVIGAGPAGSTAARHLALRGLYTLLLDARSFPRHKICGGGITARTARALNDLDLSPVIEDQTFRVVLTHGDRRIHITTGRPLVYQVQRRRFDQLLLEAAGLAGCIIRTGEAVIDLQEDDRRVEVITADRRYRAAFVVGADGGQGMTARHIGSPLRRWCGAVEWEYPLTEEEHVSRWAGALDFDFSAVRDGYGWIFPKQAHLSVGLGVLRARRQRLPNLLKAYMHRNTLDPEREVLTRHGASLAISPQGRIGRAHSRRILLAGDAAGLTDPFSGEGIYYAVRSGQIAAGVLAGQAAGRPQLHLYQAELNSVIGEDLRWSWRLARAFYPAVDWFHRRLISPQRTGFAELLVELAQGNITYREAATRAIPLLLRAGRGKGSPPLSIEKSAIV
ncbi:MAG: geranylgeranyl reductase family protein [Thermaerobacterales bacterium]